MNPNLVKLNPWRQFEDLTQNFNRFFNQSALLNTNGEGERLTHADWYPSVDVSETKKEYLVKAELPAVKKEDIKINVEKGVLTIEGERKQESEEKTEKFHRIERSYGSFIRTFTLPPDANEKNIKAVYKDGVLSVHLLKTEKPMPTSVDIEVQE